MPLWCYITYLIFANRIIIALLESGLGLPGLTLKYMRAGYSSWTCPQTFRSGSFTPFVTQNGFHPIGRLPGFKIL